MNAEWWRIFNDEVLLQKNAPCEHSLWHLSLEFLVVECCYFSYDQYCFYTYMDDNL